MQLLRLMKYATATLLVGTNTFLLVLLLLFELLFQELGQEDPFFNKKNSCANSESSCGIFYESKSLTIFFQYRTQVL